MKIVGDAINDCSDWWRIEKRKGWGRKKKHLEMSQWVIWMEEMTIYAMECVWCWTTIAEGIVEVSQQQVLPSLFSKSTPRLNGRRSGGGSKGNSDSPPPPALFVLPSFIPTHSLMVVRSFGLSVSPRPTKCSDYPRHASSFRLHLVHLCIQRCFLSKVSLLLHFLENSLVIWTKMTKE